MPGMDGLAATALIRQQDAQAEQPRHTTIVALTANAMEDDRERCLAAGMDDYLAKPFTLAQLSALLTRWLLQPADAVHSADRPSLPGTQRTTTADAQE